MPRNINQKMRSGGESARSRILNTYLILIGFLLFANIYRAQAQGAYFWSEQERIPEYVDTASEPPYLLTDLNHTVHAFNSQPLNLQLNDSPRAIFYRQWTLENGWTEPNDILVDPNEQGMDIVGLADDQVGRVHLLIQMNGDLYYSQNNLASAGTVSAWSSPINIAGNSERSRPGVLNVAAIAATPDGNELTVVYAGSQNGTGLYFTSSFDDGNSWTDPYPVYLTGDETVIVTDPKVIFGESGRFHSVWTSFQQSGAAGIGYYADFDPVTQSWSEPFALDTIGVRTPSIFEAQGNIFVSYYHVNANGNWWRRSDDHGATWTLPEQLSSRHIGTNGAVSFVTDGANVLHAFFGERINDANHGMWHLTYMGAAWSNIEPVVRGPQVRDIVGGNGFDPRSARAVIVNGNIALVTWATDGAGGTNGAWYSYKRLDAPELPTVVLEAPTAIAVAISTLAALPENTATPVADVNPMSTLGIGAASPEFVANPQTSILLGMVPVLLLLFIIIIVFYVLQNRNT